MDFPPEITFRNLGRSEAMENKVRERIDELVNWFPDIVSCHVVIEADHRHHHKGKLYHVRVKMLVPGGEVVVGREPHKHHAHEDAYVAIRDAFDALRRRLEDWQRKRRGDVKHHEPPPHGRVTALYPDQDSGVIMSPDEREIVFHANSLVDHDFEDLELGTEVRFTEVDGPDGPRASTVHVIGKHHIVG